MAHISQDAIATAETFGKIARAFGASDDTQTTLETIVHLAAEHLDACQFAGVSMVEDGRITSPASSDGAPRFLDALQAETGEGPCLDAIQYEEVFRTGDLLAEERWPAFSNRAHEETGVRSILSMRLFIEGDTMGSLNLYSRARDAFDESDEALAAVFAAHAAIALQSAQTTGDVIVLQRNLLPAVLPEVNGMALAVRYIPASDGGRLGGDWYDALCLPDSRLALTIGDVAGHGRPAAAVMGQLRNALRGYTVAGFAPPAAVGLLSRLLSLVEPDVMATLCHMTVEAASPDTDGITIRWTNSGHPPPLVLEADGSTRFLTGEVDTPVGQSLPELFRESTTTVGPGATLFLYSDGLVERREESIDDGLARLARVAADGPRDLEAFCDHVVGGLIGADSSDDVALLALRVGPS